MYFKNPFNEILLLLAPASLFIFMSSHFKNWRICKFWKIFYKHNYTSPYSIEITISSFLVIIHFISFVFLHCLVLTLLYVAKPEKAMAPHSSSLAWKIPRIEEPVRLQSMGFQRVGHDWETSLSLFTFMHWRRNWQPTSVFLPGESQGQKSLVGCRLWGCTESGTTDAT